MNQRTRFGQVVVAVVLAAAFLIPGTALALEDTFKFELDGYYRLRLMYFQDLSPQASEGQFGDRQVQGLGMHRARLHPTLNMGERFTFNITLNLLDNAVTGDNPEILAPTPEFFSGSILPNPNPLKSINVERVWGEFLSPIGIWRFGRMGSNWGLGILANDGNDEMDDFGDTVDRIMLITKVGPIIIIPGVDKVSEVQGILEGTQVPDFFADPDSIGGQTDDVDQMILVLVYRPDDKPNFVAGAYGVYRVQPKTDSKVNVVDGWVKATDIIPGLNVEAEGLILTGKTSGVAVAGFNEIKATQWGLAVETNYTRGPFKYGLDFGAASGDDSAGIGPDDEGNIDLNNYTFDRNYRPALLLWRYVVADPIASSNAVTNALYFKPYVKYAVPVPLFSAFDLKLAIVNGRTLSDTQFYESGSYGTEVDVTWVAGLYDNRAEWQLEYGMLFPGSVFEDVSSVTDAESSIWALQGRFLIRF